MGLLFVYYNPKKWKDDGNWERLKNDNVKVKIGYRPTSCYGDEIVERYFASGDWNKILSGEWWFDIEKKSTIASNIIATNGKTKYIIGTWWTSRILNK